MTTFENSPDARGDVIGAKVFLNALTFLVGVSVGSSLDCWVGATVGGSVVGGTVGNVVRMEEARRDGLDVGARLVSSVGLSVGTKVRKSLDGSEVVVAVVAATVGDAVGFIVTCRFVAILVAAEVGNGDGAILGTVVPGPLGLNDCRNEGVDVAIGILEGVNGVLAVESKFGADVTCVGEADGAIVQNGLSITMFVHVGDAVVVSVGEVVGVICVGDAVNVVAFCVGDAVGICGTTDCEGVFVSASFVSRPSSLVEIADAAFCCSFSSIDWLYK